MGWRLSTIPKRPKPAPDKFYNQWVCDEVNGLVDAIHFSHLNPETGRIVGPHNPVLLRCEQCKKNRKHLFEAIRRITP